ncbi:EAL domain-containing protein [Kineosporia sp. J2-2]|uniref:EAL domain-containing protein n=1 Tax=Kineosporia corallincola TaxID=2835133 RepID=A0ABS5TEB2_9ACTN|nr:EAL domain-containing protein [Kineosporia corallincola]MBT0768448.1 EAL domain-containing protein [Kineosporia corallincola]
MDEGAEREDPGNPDTGPDTGPDAGPAGEEVHRSGHTRVVRRYGPAGPYLEVEILGPHAVELAAREGLILSRLAGGPGVPRLLEPPRGRTLLFEEVRGTTLPDRPAREVTSAGRLVDLLDVLVQLADVLAHVHRRGVVHRCVSPSTLVWDETGRHLLLIDFTYAGLLGSDLTAAADQMPENPAYLAPEQTGRTALQVDHRADLYAAGATAYCLATGRPPFGSGDNDLLALMHDVLTRVPVDVCEVNPVLPRVVGDIVARLLEKSPDRRYQSADGLAHDLRRLREQLGGHPDPATLPPFPVAERDFPLRLAPPSRLVGRQQEIAVLKDCLSTSGTVLVAGATGTGKTSLIACLRRSVTAAGGWFVTGTFGQALDRQADALVQVMRGIGRQLLAEPDSELAFYRRRLRAVLGRRAGEAAALFPELGLVMETEPQAGTEDLADVSSFRTRTVATMADILRTVASPGHRVVVVLDDLHLGPAFPVALLDTLTTGEPIPGLLVIAAYRDTDLGPDHVLPAYLTRWQAQDTPPVTIHLDDLGTPDLTDLLARMLRLEVPDAAALAEVVAARTHGNPRDTIDLLNLLRADGSLELTGTGWNWDGERIRRHLGGEGGQSFLAARVGELGEDTLSVLDALAALGLQAAPAELEVASGRRDLAECLAPAISEGLVERNGDVLRFAHDRVLRAVRERLDETARRQSDLAVARRLSADGAWTADAARLYLAVASCLSDPAERRAAARLMRRAAAPLRLIHPADAERLLSGSLELSEPEDDEHLRTQMELHTVLYGLGRMSEAGQLYARMQHADPQVLAGSTAVQVAALTAQGRPPDALDLGAGALARLGITVPPEFSEGPGGRDALWRRIGPGLDSLHRWARDPATPAAEEARPAAQDARGAAVAAIINRMTAPSFYSNRMMLDWLVMLSQDLWTRYGPTRSLVSSLAHACIVATEHGRDPGVGYTVLNTLLAVSEHRHWEPETSQTRCLLATSSQYWFESLPDTLVSYRRGLAGLVDHGDLLTAAFMSIGLLDVSIECESLEQIERNAEEAIGAARRAGNREVEKALVVTARLPRVLAGLEDPAGPQAGASTPIVRAVVHLGEATIALALDDAQSLHRHSAAAMELLPVVSTLYLGVRAHLLRGLSLAQQLHGAAEADRPALLAGLDACRSWLAGRAVDCPENYLHLSAWLEAEQAWATGDPERAGQLFDAAARSAPVMLSWHSALITERAAVFHLRGGRELTGQLLLTRARDLWAGWGAAAKVSHLHTRYPQLTLADPVRASPAGLHDPAGPALPLLATTGSSPDVDLLAVLRASQALSGETGFDRLGERVAEVLAGMTGATAVTLALWNQDEDAWIVPTGGATLDLAAAVAADLLPESAFRYAERTRQPLIVGDARRDDRFAGDPYLAGAACCSLMVVPITAGDTFRIMLVLENRLYPDVFTVERLDAIMLIAGQLAVAFDNAQARALREQEAERRLRLLETLRRRERLLKVLLAIQQDISHRAPLPDILDAVTGGASTMLEGAFVALVLADPLGETPPRIPSTSGLRGPADSNDAVLAIAAEAVTADHMVTASGALVAVPVHAEGQIIGALASRLPDDSAPGEHRDLLTAFAEQVSLALNDANTLQAIREAAYDSLTGLASRALFLDQLQSAVAAGIRRGGEITVLFIDLDRFKAVNDSLGHAAGDDLLSQVATRLRQCIRDSDVAARLGGDEFAVLLENTSGEETGLRLAERITAAVTRPFRIAGRDVFIGASVGIAHGAAAGIDAAGLLGQADLAMYRSKHSSTHRAVVFESKMHAEVAERLELEADLQKALEAGQFQLHYQPLVELRTGATIGVEGLLRWSHPERGPISPAVFIPVAEQTGVIVELGRWILAEGCRQVAAWRAGPAPGLELSLNVSARQLTDEHLVDDVVAVLSDTGLPAQALTLELTETVLMDDPGGTMLQFDDLRRLGIRLSIDDFGTGYSSLSYLRRFLVDKLKIDKSFIDNIAGVEEDLAIVRTVVDLARILRLQTTAEGIETAEQYELLRQLGCVVGQGYHFARPMAAADLTRYLSTRPLAVVHDPPG